MRFSTTVVAALTSLATLALAAPQAQPPSASPSTSAASSSASAYPPFVPLTTTNTTTDPSIQLVKNLNAAIPSSPISQAVISGDHLYISGYLPLAPHTGEIVKPGDVVAQSLTILTNIKILAESVGSNLGKVVRFTVYLKNVEDYDTFNMIYANFMGSHRPARTTVAAADIPLGVLVEIDAIVRYALRLA